MQVRNARHEGARALYRLASKMRQRVEAVFCHHRAGGLDHFGLFEGLFH